MEKENLIKLVQQAKAGDAEAIGLLYAEYRNVAFTMAMQETNNRALADDIVQEAFIKVINKIDTLRVPEAFPSWLKQIVRNQCHEYFDTKIVKYERLAIENEESFTLLDTEEEVNATFIPDEALNQKELKATILTMIGELPAVQRSALYMFYYDDLPLKTIAEVQGVSVNTANTRLHRGRSAVKASIEQYEKKHGIRLRTFVFLPFFKWLWSGTEETMSSSSAATVAQNVSAATGVTITTPEAITTGVTATTATATTATTSTAASASICAKIAAMPIVTKIVSGIVAASIVVGMPIAISSLRNEPQDLQGETEATEWMSEEEETQYTEPTDPPVEPTTPIEIDVQPFYQEIITQHQTAIENNFNFDATGIPMNSDGRLKYINLELWSEARGYQNFGGIIDEHFTVYYSFVDLNEDGRKELFIGAGTSLDNIRIFDLFTLDNEDPVRVFKDTLGCRTNLTVFSDMTLQISSSGGVVGTEYTNYVLESGSCTPTPKDKQSGSEVYQFDWNPIPVRENLIATFTPAQQKAVNVFISNFAEQSWIDPYPCDDIYLLHFAFVHNHINYDDKITYPDTYTACISAKDVDITLNRFFGHSIEHRSLADTQYNIQYEYRDGFYYHPAADGEPHCSFAIVRGMYSNNDGTYDVIYDVFHGEEIDSLGYVSYIENPKPYYSLSPNDVKDHPELKWTSSGKAVIKGDVNTDSKASYQMVSME